MSLDHSPVTKNQGRIFPNLRSHLRIRVLLPTLFLLFISACLQAKATVLEVDSNSASASDTNVGTADRPLKSISAAARKVKAGDKVVIHGGDYRETIVITTSGTEQEPIIFEAAPGARPVIKGSEIVNDWKRETDSIWRAQLPQMPPRSLDSKEPSFWNTDDVRMVFTEDGVLLEAQHLGRVDKRDDLQPGTFFYNIADSSLFLQMEKGTDPNRLRIEATRRAMWMHVWGSNVIIRGLDIRHCGNSGAMRGPGCFLRGDNVLMENCRITWSDDLAVLFAGNRDRLNRCVIACHGNSAIGGKGEEHVISWCRVLYNNWHRYDPAWHCGGAKLIPSYNHGQVIHSEFAYNVGPGLWLDGGCNDNLIEGNLCHNNEGAGILVEISARNRLFNNVCFENRNFLTADFLTPEGDSGSKFKLIRRGKDLKAQFLYHAGDGRGIEISSAPDTKVYHNTCYLNEGEGISVEGEKRSAEGIPMSSSGCELLNNISIYNKGTQLVFRQETNKDGRTSGRSDYNIIETLGAVFAQKGWNSPFIRSLKDWQATGFDQHSIQDDPSFAMATMGDFRLLPISPALKAAPALADVPRDFLGRPRSDSTVSIGAFETPAFDYPRPASAHLDDDPR